MAFRLSLLCFLLAFRLSAQLPDGSVAPDFQATDIKGQIWHLYDLLEQDKIVFLEISATWCAPCWSYHKSKALQNCYEAHGPNGSDRLRVLFVEGDPDTNLDCLYGLPGCNLSSLGNWVADTPFPIIDNAYIADLYQIKYYPTVYVICPNKKLYQVGALPYTEMWQKAQTCPVANGSHNAGIFDYSLGSDLREVCDTLPLNPQFNLINLGSNPLTSASIDLKWNNQTVQSIHWTGDLSLYGEASIQFDSLPIAQSGQLTTIVSNINSTTYEADTSNNVRSDHFSAAANFGSQEVLLRIRTDEYGAETYWELRDEQGNVLDSGGNQSVGPNGGGNHVGSSGGLGAYGNFALIKDTLLLPAGGCYSLHFVDAYGDGMCCEYGTGYYRLYNLNNPTSIIMSGGDFGAYDHRAFGAQQTVWLDNIDDQRLALDLFVYPNPANDVLYADLSTPELTDVQFEVYNTVGQLVRNFPLHSCGQLNSQPIPLDIAGLPPGLYVLRAIVAQGSIRSQTFIVGQ